MVDKPEITEKQVEQIAQGAGKRETAGRRREIQINSKKKANHAV